VPKHVDGHVRDVLCEDVAAPAHEGERACGENDVDRGARARAVRDVFRDVLDAVLLRRPRLESSPATSLAELIETALRSIKRRSLVFIVSDFFTMPGWEKPLGLLAQRHETLAIRLTDPRERELPDIGFVIMTDSETGEALHIDTHDARFRKRFAEVVGKRERELGAAFRRANVDTLELSTEQDLVRTVVRFAATRKLRRARQRAMGRAS